MSTALYRRYRPETFADVIGQEHVTVPLMQALRTGRVAHAYLFSGPRGCGKTTSARILARCLNCEQGPTPEPCGVCESCVALARGGPGTIDVIEIDAASHGGVDDARDLRERASYGPAQSRYKVYIIDEAHMVTPQGFNALLKIVEEPPEHVKFVFATTEPEKVIGTIRSRTHHYPFRLVPPALLTSYMDKLCQQEQVSVAPGVLGFVTRAGGGSVRDSLSVLDQLIAGSGDEGLTYEGAASLLGFTDAELLDATVDALAAGDGAAVFLQVDKVVESGHDPRRFVEDLLERLRDLIIIAAVQEGAGSVLRGVPEDQLERMRGQQARFGPGALSRAADIVNAGLTEMTGATAPRMHLELICARVLLPSAAGSSGHGARLDRLERRLDLGGVPSAAGGHTAHLGPAPSGPAPSGLPPSRPPQSRSAPPAPSDGRPGTGAAGPAGVAGAVSHGTTPAVAPTSAGGPRETSASVPLEQGAPAPPRDASAGAMAGGGAAGVDAAEGGQDGGATGVGAAGGGEVVGGMDTAAIRRVWPDVLARVFGMRRATWTFLSQHAQVAEYDGTRLVLEIATVGLANTFRQGNHAELVRQALIDEVGVNVPVEGRPPSGGSGPTGPGGAGLGDPGPGGRGPGDPGPGGPGAPGVGGPAGAAAPARPDTPTDDVDGPPARAVSPQASGSAAGQARAPGPHETTAHAQGSPAAPTGRAQPSEIRGGAEPARGGDPVRRPSRAPSTQSARQEGQDWSQSHAPAPEWAAGPPSSSSDPGVAVESRATSSESVAQQTPSRSAANAAPSEPTGQSMSSRSTAQQAAAAKAAARRGASAQATTSAQLSNARSNAGAPESRAATPSDDDADPSDADAGDAVGSRAGREVIESVLGGTLLAELDD